MAYEFAAQLSLLFQTPPLQQTTTDKALELAVSFSQSLSQWAYIVIGGSVAVLLRDLKYRPTDIVVRHSFWLFVPGWAGLVEPNHTQSVGNALRATGHSPWCFARRDESEWPWAHGGRVRGWRLRRNVHRIDVNTGTSSRDEAIGKVPGWRLFGHPLGTLLLSFLQLPQIPFAFHSSGIFTASIDA